MNGRLHLKPVKDCINRWSCHFGVDHDEDRITGHALAYWEAYGHAHGVWSLDPCVISLIEQNPNSLTIVKKTQTFRDCFNIPGKCRGFLVNSGISKFQNNGKWGLTCGFCLATLIRPERAQTRLSPTSPGLPMGVWPRAGPTYLSVDHVGPWEELPGISGHSSHQNCLENCPFPFLNSI